MSADRPDTKSVAEPLATGAPPVFHDAMKHWWDAQLAEEAKKRMAKVRKNTPSGEAPVFADGDEELAAGAGIRGGKSMNGFWDAIVEALLEVGVDKADIFPRAAGDADPAVEGHLPSFFRATKKWDLVVCKNSLHRTYKKKPPGEPHPRLIAAIEFKSQFESIGKNQNNRIEECLGSAHDVWRSHRLGVLGATKHEPWIGYIFVGKYATRDAEHKDWKPVRIAQPHIPAEAAFCQTGKQSSKSLTVQGISYAQRYELFLNRMKEEGLYDGACFITTHDALHGENHLAARYECPFDGLDENSFLKDLQRHVIANYHDDPVAFLTAAKRPSTP